MSGSDGLDQNALRRRLNGRARSLFDAKLYSQPLWNDRLTFARKANRIDLGLIVHTAILLY